jgi:1-acyl-sn-glycerol-3-phosphate acyltransferase
MNHDRLRKLFRLLLKLLARVEADGMENIPEEGGFILASNHLGTLDVPLIATHVMRNDATLLAAKKHRKNPLYRRMIDAVGGIWIDRYQADYGAMRSARAALRQGKMLGVAPEGTRSPTGALIEGKAGVAYLASLSGAPILPVGIRGTDRAAAELRRLRRPVVGIRFGRLFTLEPLDRNDREQELQRRTDEIMCRIAVLLPPQYWGVYAGHPRLEALLQDGRTEEVQDQTAPSSTSRVH